MWQEKQAELLKDEIETVLAALPDMGGLRDLAREPLTEARRGLSEGSAHDRPWPLLPLMVCESISGRYEPAVPAAASVQFLMAACDVFDDVEDADSPDSLSARYGLAVATNVATALLFLGEKAIMRLNKRGVDTDVIVHVTDVLNSFYTIACTGQHLDLLSSPEAPLSEEDYLQIISMKSASQIECACQLGALLATQNKKLVDTLSVFGQNLGMAAQITNDIQGAIYGNDITRRKMTLPIIYAFAQTDGKVRSQLELSYQAQSELKTDPTPIRDVLFQIGAIHYATTKMQFYRQRASDVISKAEGAGANFDWVRLFLEEDTHDTLQ